MPETLTTPKSTCQLQDKRSNNLAFASISILVLLLTLYGNSFTCGWHLDDHLNITENPNVQLSDLTWHNIKSSFYGTSTDSINRPLSFFTLAINYYFNKTDVFGYHLFNFTVHYLAALFLFLFVSKITTLPSLNKYRHQSYNIALLSSVLWAANPLQVTAVTYIVQRMTSLAALFCIISMYCYVCARTSSTKREQFLLFLATLLSGVLAFASKENSIMLPVNLYLIDILLIQRCTPQSLRKNATFALYVIIATLIYIFSFSHPFSLIAEYQTRPFTLTERLLTQPRIILYYLSLLFYPIDQRLALLHDFQWSQSLLLPWTTLPAIMVLLGSAIFSICQVIKRPLISFCILFFLVNHLIEGTFLPLEMIFEHRNYLPSMMLFVIPSLGILSIFDYFSYNRTRLLTLLAVVALLLTAIFHTTIARNRILKNEITLWSDNSEKFPRLIRPYISLGRAYFEKNHFALALDTTMKGAINTRSDRLDDYQKIIFNLGQIHLALGNYEQAGRYFNQLLSLEPSKAELYHSLAKIMIHKKRYSRAISLSEKAISLQKDKAEFYYIYALASLKLGKLQTAIREAKHALIMDPATKLPLWIIGEGWRGLADFERSARYYKEFLVHYPSTNDAKLALVEISQLLQKSNERDIYVFELCAELPGEALYEAIRYFRDEINTFGEERITTIKMAVKESLSSKSKQM